MGQPNNALATGHTNPRDNSLLTLVCNLVRQNITVVAAVLISVSFLVAGIVGFGRKKGG